MCMQAIDKINKKHQHYTILLRLCQKRLHNDEIPEIEADSRTSLMIKIPTYEFKDIDKFYASDFLKEYNKVKYIASMGIQYATDMLKRDHGLFMGGRSNTVNCIALTSDNKYMVTGSDNTLNIWSLQTKSQVAALPGHVSKIASVAIISDNNFIVSGSYDSTIRMNDQINIQNSK